MLSIKSNNLKICYIIIILFIILAIIAHNNFNIILLTYGKLFRPVFYNSFFLPELKSLLINKNIIKNELMNALNSPINKIYRKNEEWSNSNNGEEFVKKINMTEGWIYSWNNNNKMNTQWLNFGLMYNNKNLEANSKICPKTCEILKNIKGINVAGFSLMTPNSKIEPHTDSTGINNNSIGIHFGLIIPDKNKCILTVNNTQILEEEDKIFGFDSNYTHSAVNNSDKDRIILYIDKSII